MSFVHVFGVNVDIGFIIFVIMAVCALVIGIRVATMKGRYVDDTNSNDNNFMNGESKLNSSSDYINDPIYDFLDCNVYHDD